MAYDAIIAAVVGGVTAIFSSGVAWGLISQRVNVLQENLKEHREEADKNHQIFVTHAYFEAVTSPLRTAIETIQKDIKEILKAVKS